MIFCQLVKITFHRYRNRMKEAGILWVRPTCSCASLEFPEVSYLDYICAIFLDDEMNQIFGSVVQTTLLRWETHMVRQRWMEVRTRHRYSRGGRLVPWRLEGPYLGGLRDQLDACQNELSRVKTLSYSYAGNVLVPTTLLCAVPEDELAQWSRWQWVPSPTCPISVKLRRQIFQSRRCSDASY